MEWVAIYIFDANYCSNFIRWFLINLNRIYWTYLLWAFALLHYLNICWCLVFMFTNIRHILFLKCYSTFAAVKARPQLKASISVNRCEKNKRFQSIPIDLRRLQTINLGHKRSSIVFQLINKRLPIDCS